MKISHTTRFLIRITVSAIDENKLSGPEKSTKRNGKSRNGLNGTEKDLLTKRVLVTVCNMGIRLDDP